MTWDRRHFMSLLPVAAVHPPVFASSQGATGSSPRGTTEGVNLIAAAWGAANLRPGDEVILTIAEHNSNLMPWTRAAKQAGAIVRVVDVDDEGRLWRDQLTQMSNNKRHRSPVSGARRNCINGGYQT